MEWRNPLSSAAPASNANKALVVLEAAMVVLWDSDCSSGFNLLLSGEELESLSTLGRLSAAIAAAELDSGVAISGMESNEKGATNILSGFILIIIIN